MSEAAFLEPLIQYGLLGVILGWFMWRNEKVLTKLADNQEKLTMAIINACEHLQQKKE